MQEGHKKCSKTLENIVQTRDVTAKIETQNFGNQKIYYGTFLTLTRQNLDNWK